jgi:hypothetical protein
MNLVASITRLFTFAPVSPPRREQAPIKPPLARSRRSARTVVIGFAVAFLALSIGSWLAIDYGWPQVRDPEYSRRVTRLRARMAEHPKRPVVVVIGSSRTAMGLRPGAWEEARPEGDDSSPLLFNMSLVGSGPVMELLCLRRMIADGFRPDAVIFEYWPPFLREDGPFHEPGRIDVNRLRWDDVPLVEEYYTEPEKTERAMYRARLNPIFETRHRLVAQVVPSTLPWRCRMDVGWQGLDAWGWLPGLDEDPPNPSKRIIRLNHCSGIYSDQLKNNYHIHPVAEKAIHECVDLARANGAKVAFAWLPESTEFRTWYPPETERAGQDCLNRLRQELDVPLIDARLWMPDVSLVDGFHLSQKGAAAFSQRFGPAVASTFPGLSRRP